MFLIFDNEQKAHQKFKATSSEAFAVEQAEMSEFSDASDNIKEIPECRNTLFGYLHIQSRKFTRKNLRKKLTDSETKEF
jgi:hypothetical protein